MKSRRNQIVIMFMLHIPFNLSLILKPTLAQEDLTSLVRRVQENSQRSYESIRTVSFKGHSKTYLYFGYSPLKVDMVPMHEEYYFEGFWMKPDSLRLVIKALRSYDSDADSIRETIMRDMPLPNPFRFIYDPSMLGIDDEKKEDEDENEDDDILLWPLYPFAVGADSVYDYRFEGEIGFGENRVILIHVSPKNPDMPAAVGTFMIDAYRQEVVGSDMRFNQAMSIFNQAAKQKGPMIKLLVSGTNTHRVKTEKELFYASYWLPAGMEEEFDIGIWSMDVKMRRFITFDSYIVNPEEPDSSLLTDQKIVYARDPNLEDEVFKDQPHPQRLSKQQQEQIINHIKDRLASSDIFGELLDSETIAKEAAGMALKQRFGRHIAFVGALGDYIVYNRVEGLRLRYEFTAGHWPINNTAISIGGGYGFSDKRWKGEATVLFFLNKKRNIFFDGHLYSTMGYEESRRRISTGNNTFTSLLYKGDYRDYYYRTGGSFGAGLRITDQLALKLDYVVQQENRAETRTKFSIFRNSRPFRLNPDIVEGRFRSLHTSLVYRSHNFDVDMKYEVSNPKVFKSDFSYSYIKATLRYGWRITYHSDLFLHATGAVSWGSLPPQRWFDFGGRSFLNYHGNLRGVDYKAFIGDRMTQAVLEYSVKGGTLYDLGLRHEWIKTIKLTLWGGIGWSAFSDNSLKLSEGLDVPRNTTEHGYHEFGLAIGDVLNLFRVDFIRNKLRGNEFLIQMNILQ